MWRQISSTEWVAAISSSWEAMSTPMKQGWRMGGQATRTCTSSAPGLAQQLHQRAGGGAPHDGVVDQHDPPAGQVAGQRVELHGHAGLAQGGGGLDERPPDVAALDEALGEGDAGLLGVADGVGGARVGHGDDQVGARLGRFPGQLAAQRLTGAVHLAPGEDRVGAGEVDLLERAEGGLAGRRALVDLVAALGVEADDLAGADLAHHAGPDRGEGAALGGEAEAAVLQLAQRQRAQAPGVAHAVDRVPGEDHQRVGALRPGHEDPDAGQPVDAGPAGAGQQVQHDLAVGGRREPDAPFEQLPPQLRRVDQVAVVGEGQGPVHRLDHVGLGVAQPLRAGRGVAGVADGEVAGHGSQVLLGEDLADEAHPLVHVGGAPVAGDDAGCFLAPVLQGVEGEEGEAGDGLARGADGEDPTGFARAVGWVHAGCGSSGSTRRRRAASTRSSARRGRRPRPSGGPSYVRAAPRPCRTGAGRHPAPTGPPPSRARPPTTGRRAGWPSPRGGGDAVPPSGRPHTARSCWWNCEVSAASIVRWPELWGRGAISLASTRRPPWSRSHGLSRPPGSAGGRRR